MLKEKTYTIKVKKIQVEVSREVYKAYHRAREAERYQKKVIQQTEMSLERFQEEGVSAKFQAVRYQPGIEEEIIRAEDIQRLYRALEQLNPEDRLLIDKLFFESVTERELAARLHISQQAVNKRKKRLLKKLREIIQ